MKQLLLDFDRPRKELAPQQKRILRRLREGPATSVDLNRICYRYCARIWELKQPPHSYDIRKRRLPRRNGVCLYWLVEGEGER